MDERMLAAAETLLAEDGLTNVTLTQDDYFASTLPVASFDLVHLRFQVSPLGRGPEQVAIASRLVKPGGWVVLEDVETGTWREHPLAPAAAHLRTLIIEAFARSGGDANAGRRLVEYLRGAGIQPEMAAECLALPPGHPYLQLTLQFATALRPRLLPLVEEAELDRLLQAAQAEMAESSRWGTTFTLIQAWGRT
jgi:hypothetical protein